MMQIFEQYGCEKATSADELQTRQRQYNSKIVYLQKVPKHEATVALSYFQRSK